MIASSHNISRTTGKQTEIALIINDAKTDINSLFQENREISIYIYIQLYSCACMYCQIYI